MCEKKDYVRESFQTIKEAAETGNKIFKYYQDNGVLPKNKKDLEEALESEDVISLEGNHSTGEALEALQRLYLYADKTKLSFKKSLEVKAPEEVLKLLMGGEDCE